MKYVLTNGDIAAEALSGAFPDAIILAWRDALIEGPVPETLDDASLDDRRAEYLASAFGLERDVVRQDFAVRENIFARINAEDEVELWFETDLHDQLQLIQILDRFSRFEAVPEIALALTAPPLTGADLETLTRSFFPVSHEHLEAAATLWSAFRAPSPERLLDESLRDAPLPEARAAFARLLEEFPSPKDGLGRIERETMKAIEEGERTPSEAFRTYQATEPLPFLGDWEFFLRLDALGHAATPLVTGLPSKFPAAQQLGIVSEYVNANIALTKTGRAALAGEQDRVAAGGLDRWIGGVHLTEDHAWRFDPENRRLLPP